MEIKSKSSYTSLINAFQDETDFSIFTGAGISRRAGVPTASEIVDELSYKFDSVEQGMGYAEAWEEALPGKENAGKRRALIEGWFAGHPPITGNYQTSKNGDEAVGSHYLISHLIESGSVDAVLTTNFDHLQEQALNNYCSKLHRIYQYDELIDPREFEYHYPKVFKLHGDFLYDDLANLNDEMQQRLNLSMRRKLVDFLQDSGLIVSGYSGGDDSIMELLEKTALEGTGLSGGLWWVSYSSIDESSGSTISQLRDIMDDAGKPFHVIQPPEDGGNIPAHRFLRKLCLDLKIGEPEVHPFGVHKDKAHVLDSISSHFGTPRQFPIEQGRDENSVGNSNRLDDLLSSIERDGITWVVEQGQEDISQSISQLRSQVEPERPFLYFSYRFSQGISWSQFMEDVKLVANSAGIPTIEKSDYGEILRSLFATNAVVVIDDIGFEAESKIELNFWKKIRQIVRFRYQAKAGNLVFVSPTLPNEQQIMDLHHAKIGGTQLSPGGSVKGIVSTSFGISNNIEYFRETNGTSELAKDGVRSQWPSGRLEPSHIGIDVIRVPYENSTGSEEDSKSSIRERIKSLPDGDADLLHTLSVLRFAEPAHVIRRIVNEPVQDRLDQLVEEGFIENRNGKYWPRLSLRELILSETVDDEARESTHDRIARGLDELRMEAHQQFGLYYTKEAEFHYWESKQYTSSVRMLMSMGDTLLANGYEDFIYNTIRDYFELKGIDSHEFFFNLDDSVQVQALILYFRAGIASETGKTQEFLDTIDWVYDAISDHWSPILRSFYEGLVEEHSERFKSAIQSFKVIDASLEDGDNDELLAHAHHGIYRNHSHIIDNLRYDRGKKEFHQKEFLKWNESAREYFLRIGDHESAAKCKDDRAGMLLGMGSVDEALEALESAREAITKAEGLHPSKGVYYGNQFTAHCEMVSQSTPNGPQLEYLRTAEGYYLESAINYVGSVSPDGLLRLFKSLLKVSWEVRNNGNPELVPTPSHVVDWAFEVWKLDHDRLIAPTRILFWLWQGYVVSDSNYFFLISSIEHLNKFYRYYLDTDSHYAAFEENLMFIEILEDSFETHVIRNKIIPRLESYDVKEMLAYQKFLNHINGPSESDLSSFEDDEIPQKYNDYIQRYLEK